MELFKQLWVTSAPFRVLVCVTAVSAALAISTRDFQPGSSENTAVGNRVPDDDPPSGGVLDEIRKHLPGQQPRTPTGRVTKAAKDMTKIGATVGTEAAEAGIDAAGELAEQVLGGIGK